MAERRMFAKTIVDSDLFLDLPLSTQCLYFHLAMRADDDGFVNNPRKIERMIGANDGDLRSLMENEFILPFESGVVVIRHWRVHNCLRKDRYNETAYKSEKACLTLDESGIYNLGIPDGNQLATNWQPDGNQMATQVSIVKGSLDKGSLEKSISAKRTTKFTPPTVEEVKAYCEERKNGIDAQHFCDYYETRGWKVGRNTMKDWKAAVRTWERNDTNVRNEKPDGNTPRAGTENWDWGTVI